MEAWEIAYFVLPDGRKVALEVHDDIPYLNDNSIVCPATSVVGPIASAADEEDVDGVAVDSDVSDCEVVDPKQPARETHEMTLRKQAKSLEHL